MAPTDSVLRSNSGKPVTTAPPKPWVKPQIEYTTNKTVGSSLIAILPSVDKFLRTLSLDLIDTELNLARKKSSLYKFNEIVKGVQFVSKSFRYKLPSFSVSAETMNHLDDVSILSKAHKKWTKQDWY